MKTVLITGCSSGFGLEIARFFVARDWHVVATMRTPRNDVLPPSDHLRVLALDVTSAESIRAAVEGAGPIDAVISAGWAGALVHEVDSTRAFSSRIAMAMIRLVARILMNPGMGTRSSASRW